MNWIQKIAKVFTGLLVLVHVTIAFNPLVVSVNTSSSPDTEMLSVKGNRASKALHYSIAKKILPAANSITASSCILQLPFPEADTHCRTVLKVQNGITMVLKAPRLQILLNDSIQQKSHWI